MNWLDRLTIAAAIAFLVLVAFSMWDDGPLDWIFPVGEVKAIDFKTLERSPKPNQFLMCPSGYCAAQTEAASPVYNVSVEALTSGWDRMIAGEPRLKRLAEDAEKNTVEYVQRTPLMRYPDIISVQFIALGPDRSTLAIYSRLIYGRSDMGVNEARVRSWMKKLTSALAVARA
ncbi:MAG: DUF1499 domain-containing protein [Alphaproteobacteria bacterium]|nr:DUF1499 domain-containing protein [Alphaproteobacteria bacterium]